MFAVQWHHIDICSTTILKGLCFKFHLDSHCNLAVRKNDPHTKRHLGSLIPKFMCYYPVFVVTEERENKVWTESTTLDRQREINHHRSKEVDKDLVIIPLIFCCSSCSWLLGVPSLHLCGSCGNPFARLIPNRYRTFQPVFTSLHLICRVGWGCRIHWLHLCRGVRPPPTSVLDMTLNSLMVRSQ